jgi:hypothetical protein
MAEAVVNWSRLCSRMAGQPLPLAQGVLVEECGEVAVLKARSTKSAYVIAAD